MESRALPQRSFIGTARELSHIFRVVRRGLVNGNTGSKRCESE